MNTQRHASIPSAVTILFLLALPLSVSALILNPPQCYQEQDQWCWAGTSQSVLALYGTNFSQTDIAQYGTDGANNWNWTYGTSYNPTQRGVDDILLHFRGIASSGLAYALSLAETQNELDTNGRPVVIRWGWDSGGGHILVLHGITNGMAYLMDPWYGPTINTFGWVNRGNTHTWTHTLRLTTVPGTIGVAPASIHFGPVVPGTSLDRNFTLTNSGLGTIVGAVSVPPPFIVTSGGYYRMTNSETALVSIRFTPTGNVSNVGAAAFTGGGRAAGQLFGSGQPLAMTGPHTTTNGICFSLSGPAGDVCLIQVSLNLSNWVTLWTNVISSNGLAAIVDTNALSTQRRFYRAKFLSSGQ